MSFGFTQLNAKGVNFAIMKLLTQFKMQSSWFTKQLALEFKHSAL